LYRKRISKKRLALLEQKSEDELAESIKQLRLECARLGRILEANGLGPEAGKLVSNEVLKVSRAQDKKLSLLLDHIVAYGIATQTLKGYKEQVRTGEAKRFSKKKWLEGGDIVPASKCLNHPILMERCVCGEHFALCPICYPEASLCPACRREWRSEAHLQMANRKQKKEQLRRYYRAHREGIAGYRHRYRYDNRDHLRDYHRRYRQDNQERLAENARRYQRANREHIAETKRSYYQANRERLKEKQRRYRQANRQRIAESNRRYRQKNRERLKERQRS
jgi:hypothetical protein